MGNKEGAYFASRPCGMGNVGQKCLPLERIPKEAPSFSESKEVKFIVRVVADDEPWIHGRIWGVHKRWEMSTDGRCTWSPEVTRLSDKRYSESLGLLVVTVPGKTCGHLDQSRWSLSD